MKIPVISNWVEKRSTLKNPEPWFLRVLNGLPAASGVNVNEQSAMRSTAVFGCIRIHAETVSTLPLPVYRRMPNGGKTRAPEHPLYEVLHNIANPEMTAMTFRETLQAHISGWGNGYAYIVRDNGNRIRELWPLLPDRTYPERNKQTGELYYVTTRLDGQQVKLRKEDVLHIPGLGFDGLKGYSPIQLAREAVGLGLAAEEFGSRFFGQGTNLGAVIEHPGKLSDTAHQNLKKDIADKYQGLGKSHLMMILEEGMKLQKIGIPPNDAQFLETRKFQVTEIARIFRVPPHMLADLERATFSNIEHQSIDFVVHCIRPWLVRWEQAIYMKLFAPEERKLFFAEHIIDGLLRGDIQSRYQAYSTGRQWGWMSVNDIRELENMNPVENGDIYLQPLNMVEAGTDPFKIPETDEGRTLPPIETRSIEERRARSVMERSRLAKAYEKVIRDAAARVVKREKADITRAIDKYLRNRSTPQFNEWLTDFYEQAPEWIQRTMLPVISSYTEAIQAAAAEEVGAEPGMTAELDSLTRQYAEAMSIRHINSSRGQLQALVSEAISQVQDPAEVLSQRLAEWEETRPAKIASRETIQAAAAVTKAVFMAAGVTTLRWVNTGSKSCPYCEAMDGKVVGIESNFISAGEDFEPEGANGKYKVRGPIGHPPLHQGCRCMIVSG